jgi:hypothetical protein
LFPGFVIKEDDVSHGGKWGITKSPDKITGAFRLFRFFFGKFRFRKLLVEFIDTAGGVHEFHLSGKERMRLAGNLQFDEGIFFPVLPFDGVFGGGAGLGQEGEITGEILEHDVPVISRMGIFFHDKFKNGVQR